MNVFTESELDYLASQPLGRLATLGPDGAPQNRPVGYTYNHNLQTIDIIGMNLKSSRKYRNIEADGRVSFVVDDLVSTTPWMPRGIEIRGRAELISTAPTRPGLTGDMIRIHPVRVLAWGLDTDAFATPNSRNVTD